MGVLEIPDSKRTRSYRSSLAVLLFLTAVMTPTTTAFTATTTTSGRLQSASSSPYHNNIGSSDHPHSVAHVTRQRRHSAHSVFGLWAKARSSKSSSSDDDDDDADVPDDWNDEEVVLGNDDFSDVVMEGDGLGVEEEEATVMASGGVVDDDEDDDDIEIVNIDDDEEEEEEKQEMSINEEELDIIEESLEEEIASEYEDDGTETFVGDEPVEWDDEEDGIIYELMDNPEDPNYSKQKELVLEDVRSSEQKAADEAFDADDFLEENLSEELAEKLAGTDFFKKVEAMSKDMILAEDDVEGIDLDDELTKVSDVMEDPFLRNEPEETNFLEETSGVTDDDLDRLDETYKGVQETLSKEPWDKVMLQGIDGIEHLPNTTLSEIKDCLTEISGASYNVTRWLLYDLNFNVSNLILAACQHNPEAPVIFQHWFPQLLTHERYQHARDRDFEFTWHDVKQADVSELARYYAGFGYNEIPLKMPGETGIISLEDLDEEEIKMAAFENWMTDVYNPEADRKDFDDDLLRDEDNVFSDFYETPQHPDLPSFDDAEDDIEEWKAEMKKDFPDDDDSPEAATYRDMMGRTFEYEIVEDEEFQKEFRGHLIIACTGEESDLEICEKITLKFEKEFSKQVFVETRVMALAREEDNVFEIWLESYEVDLLHSKRRATANAKGWDGPAEVDAKQIEFLTNRVRYLISDDARYSYRLELDQAEV